MGEGRTSLPPGSRVTLVLHTAHAQVARVLAAANSVASVMLESYFSHVARFLGAANSVVHDLIVS